MSKILDEIIEETSSAMASRFIHGQEDSTWSFVKDVLEYDSRIESALKLQELVNERIKTNKERPFTSCGAQSTVHGDNQVKREIEIRILEFLVKEAEKI